MVISATTSGFTHRHLMNPKPNQDSIFAYEDEEIKIGVVCDGCGEIPMSHVGSALVAKCFGKTLMDDSKSMFALEELFERAYNAVMGMLLELSLDYIPKEWFLTTIVAAVIRDNICYSICWGDGHVETWRKNGSGGVINGHRSVVPNYPLRDTPETFEPEVIDNIDRVIIGSDGLLDLKKVCSFEYFEDLYNLKSSVQLQRKLNLFNYRKPMQLPDDTTLVIMK